MTTRALPTPRSAIPRKDPEPAPVQVVRHVAFEDLGTIGGELDRLGLAFDDRQLPCHQLANVRSADLLIVMGGPISVNDTDRFPFLREEIELIRYRIDNRLPTLGICLGAQLIARAMGAAVVPMAEPEIGWGKLALTDAGKAGPLRHLASPVLHWHGETFDLPPGCQSLAATPRCANQAFAIEHHTLALQFHIEVTANALEHWLVGHVHELDHNGISVPKLRNETLGLADRATAQGRKVFREWFSACRTEPPNSRDWPAAARRNDVPAD